MHKLKKVQLDFDRTIDYFKDHIDGGVSLSDLILKHIDFKKGHFYTFLPFNAFFEKIYDFKYGEILPNPNPKLIKKVFWGKEFKGYTIPTLDDELYNYIIDLLKKDKSKRCIFNDYNVNFSEKKFLKSKGSFTLNSNNEVYHLINNECLLEEKIIEIIRHSDCYWYMLGIITKGIDLINKTLSKKDLLVLCQNIEIIITGAYDGEGYIFWEKNN